MTLPVRLLALLSAVPLLLVPVLASCGGERADERPAGAARPGAEAPVLRVGAIPDQKPEKLNRLHPLVAEELGRQLGVQVRYVPVVDYAAAVSAFRTGDLDLVWFGGLSGVQARLQKPGARVLAQRDIDARFHSVFIAGRASGLTPINDVGGLTALRGRRFTFGAENSTSGTLMPLYYLEQAGVKPEAFAGGAPGYSSSHDSTIALVQSGAYEAGAVNEQVWRTSLEEGRADPGKVMVIWRTPAYPDYHWIAQPDLDRRFGRGFGDRLRAAILAWSPEDQEQRRILELFGAERFIPADAGAYGRIEAIGRSTGRIR
ncbi:MAG: putative selenate ABC transporter substrate-binding protein [Synechococcaceae cyanobacterium]|nr:putative selenate ABC transporter substrate-binding protein [Synechococcaceae cyanobacterium]